MFRLGQQRLETIRSFKLNARLKLQYVPYLMFLHFLVAYTNMFAFKTKITSLLVSIISESYCLLFMYNYLFILVYGHVKDSFAV